MFAVVPRKRYDAAEAEFVAAKLELHRTSESKELLSEHLCTIIQQNEARKAEKLAELLKTLELENSIMDSSHPVTDSQSRHALFQKTPTPGINIWPHNKTGSKETSPSHKYTILHTMDTQKNPTMDSESSSRFDIEGEHITQVYSDSGEATTKTFSSNSDVPSIGDKTTSDPSLQTSDRNS